MKKILLLLLLFLPIVVSAQKYVKGYAEFNLQMQQNSD